MIYVFIILIHSSMQLQLSNQYSPSEIYEARDEILKLQTNLNKIEELYHNLYSTLDDQQVHVEGIEISVQQTEMNIEKGGLDLYQILQSRRKKDKHRCFIIIFISTTACFFLLIVISVLINVIKTFGFKQIVKSNDEK
jgi:t-SNARE complex subunit (syntaxin)